MRMPSCSAFVCFDEPGPAEISKVVFFETDPDD